jgi:hypothetical protein
LWVEREQRLVRAVRPADYAARDHAHAHMMVVAPSNARTSTALHHLYPGYTALTTRTRTHSIVGLPLTLVTGWLPLLLLLLLLLHLLHLHAPPHRPAPPVSTSTTKSLQYAPPSACSPYPPK